MSVFVGKPESWLHWKWRSLKRRFKELYRLQIQVGAGVSFLGILEVTRHFDGFQDAVLIGMSLLFGLLIRMWYANIKDKYQ